MQWDTEKLSESIHYKLFNQVPGETHDVYNTWESQEFYEQFLEIFPDGHNGVAQFWVFQERDRDELSQAVRDVLWLGSTFKVEKTIHSEGTDWHFTYGQHEFVGRWCYLVDSGGLVSGVDGGQLLVMKDPGETKEMIEGTMHDYFGSTFTFER